MTLPKDYRPPDPPSRYSRYKWWIIVFILIGSVFAISLYYGIKAYLEDSDTDWISFKLGISFTASLIVFAVGRYIVDSKYEHASGTEQWTFWIIRRPVLPFICAFIWIAVFILIL